MSRRISSGCLIDSKGGEPPKGAEMGKGDQRSRRGKIFAGSYGKTRSKKKKKVVKPAEESKAKAAKKVK